MAKDKKKDWLKPEINVKGELITVTIKFKNDNNGGHPHVIVDNIDDNHVSVGLTTDSKKGKNAPNKKLTVSPIPVKKGKSSFMHRQGTVAPKKAYRKPRTGKMTSEDLERAKQYGERAKQKYIKNKHKKNNDVPNT